MIVSRDNWELMLLSRSEEELRAAGYSPADEEESSGGFLGGLSDTARGLGQGALGLAEMALDATTAPGTPGWAASRAQEALGLQPTMDRGEEILRRELSSAQGSLSRSYDTGLSTALGDLAGGDLGALGQIGRGVAAGAPSVLPTVIGAGVGGPVGAALVGGGMGFLESRRDVLDAGGTEMEASLAGAINAPVSALLEKIPGAGIISRKGAGLGKRVLGGFLDEGLTEGAQSLASNTIEAAVGPAELDLATMGREALDEAIAGGILGGGLGAISSEPRELPPKVAPPVAEPSPLDALPQYVFGAPSEPLAARTDVSPDPTKANPQYVPFVAATSLEHTPAEIAAYTGDAAGREKPKPSITLAVVDTPDGFVAALKERVPAAVIGQAEAEVFLSNRQSIPVDAQGGIEATARHTWDTAAELLGRVAEYTGVPEFFSWMYKKDHKGMLEPASMALSLSALSGDPGVAMHELTHVWRKFMGKRDPEGMAKLEQILGVLPAQGFDAAQAQAEAATQVARAGGDSGYNEYLNEPEERFADMAMQYFATRQAPVPELVPVFEGLREWAIGAARGEMGRSMPMAAKRFIADKLGGEVAPERDRLHYPAAGAATVNPPPSDSVDTLLSKRFAIANGPGRLFALVAGKPEERARWARWAPGAAANEVVARIRSGDMNWLSNNRERINKLGAPQLLKGIGGLVQADALAAADKAVKATGIAITLRGSSKGGSSVTPVYAPGPGKKRLVGWKLVYDEKDPEGRDKNAVAAVVGASLALGSNDKAFRGAVLGGYDKAVKAATAAEGVDAMDATLKWVEGRVGVRGRWKGSKKLQQRQLLLSAFLSSPAELAARSPALYAATGQYFQELSQAAPGNAGEILSELWNRVTMTDDSRAAANVATVRAGDAEAAAVRQARLDAAPVDIYGQKDGNLLQRSMGIAARVADGILRTWTGRDLTLSALSMSLNHKVTLGNLIKAYAYAGDDVYINGQMVIEKGAHAFQIGKGILMEYRQSIREVEALGQEAMDDFNTLLRLTDNRFDERTKFGGVQGEVALDALDKFEAELQTRDPDYFKLLHDTKRKWDSLTAKIFERHLANAVGFEGSNALATFRKNIGSRYHSANLQEASEQKILEDAMELESRDAAPPRPGTGARIKKREGSTKLSLPPIQGHPEYVANLVAAVTRNNARAAIVRMVMEKAPQYGPEASKLIEEVAGNEGSNPNAADHLGRVPVKVMAVGDRGAQVAKTFMVYLPFAQAAYEKTSDATQSALMDVAMSFSKPMTRTFTEWNPKFGLVSIVRDIAYNARNIHKNTIGLFGIDGAVTMAKAYVKAARDIITTAREDVRTRGRDGVLKGKPGWVDAIAAAGAGGGVQPSEYEMIAAGMSIAPSENFGAMIGGDGPGRTFMESTRRAGYETDGRSGPPKNKLIEGGHIFMGLLGSIARVGQRAAQLSAYEYLKPLHEKGEISTGEFEHRIRSTGVPTPLNGGTQRMLLNNLFMFGGVSINGNRVALENWKRNPAQQLNWLPITLMPTIMWWMAGKGILDKILDTEDEPYKKAADMLPRYRRTGYISVPISWSEERGPLFLHIPQDPQLATIAGMFDYALDEYWDGDKINQPILDQMVGATGQLAKALMFDPDSVSPQIKALVIAAGYATDSKLPPTDLATGQRMVSQDAWTAGGVPRAWESLKATIGVTGLSNLTRQVLGAQGVTGFNALMGATGLQVDTPSAAFPMKGDHVDVARLAGFGIDGLDEGLMVAESLPILGVPFTAFFGYGSEYAGKEQVETESRSMVAADAKLRYEARNHIQSYMAKNPAAGASAAMADFRHRNPGIGHPELVTYKRIWQDTMRRARLSPRERALASLSAGNRRQLELASER